MSNRAWVTLATNDSYGLGALVLAHSLRRVGSTYPAVVLLTPAVTEAMRDRLRGVFAEVVLVDVLDSRDAAHLAMLQRPELGITFTKIHCWTLTQYEKCVFLDADTLVVQNCDELFDREELSAAPDVGWPDCFNSGVFVYKPSNETFEALVRFAQERGSFDGGDQGLLNSYFSGWARGDSSKRLPFLYNVTSAAFYSYIPALKQFGHNMKIIHFIGANKPWLQTFNWDTRSVSGPDHLRELLQLWWDLFVSQVHSHLDTSMSGVAGNLARVSPDNIESQREVLDELTRRQGWEAGNIDYMGADSFANIWAKISQTLSQPRSSPPKQATPPPKEPTPPKQPTPPKDLTSSSEVEPLQPEPTEQSTLTPIQKEADSPAPAPVTETVVQAISELETALKDESKVSTESSIVDPVKPEDKLEPEAIKSPVTETVVRAISELETALKDESKVSTESLIIDPAKPEDKLEPEAIKPTLESKVESDIKKETVAVEPETTKPDVIALDFPSGSGSEIISEKLIAPETISKSLAEPIPSADHQPENATKPETDIVQSSAADASVSVSETSEPSKRTPIPLKSLADTKLEQAESDSTQVAQLKSESSLQPVEDAAEISQTKAPVNAPPDTETLQAKAPVESPADTETSQVKALDGSSADTSISQVKATVPLSADAAVSQVRAPVGSPADIPLSPAPATEAPAVVSADIEVSSTRETPVTTEVSDTVITSTKEILASTEIPAKTETSTTTDIPALKKSSTIIDQVPATTGPTVTEAPVTAETFAAIEALTPKEAPTTTEVPTKSETLPTDVVTTTETPPAAEVSTTLKSSVETTTSVKPEVLTTAEALASIPAVADISTELPAAKEAPVKVAKSVEGFTCSVSDETKKAPSTPDKSLELSKDSASDSPPLATTPAKEDQPPTAVKSTEEAGQETRL